MDKFNINESTGLNALNDELKAEFLRQVWNDSSSQICHAKIVLDDHGAPVDYIILDINPAFEKAFGSARNQAINKRITELFPEYASMWIEKCGEASRLGNGPLSFKYLFERNQRYEVQIFPLGSGDQFISMSKEITKHDEDKIGIMNEPTSNEIVYEALNEQVELLSILMDHNPSLIFLKDEFGKYVYINYTYKKQFIGSKDWRGKTDFDFWSKESAELFRANDQAMLASGQVTQYLEDSKDLNGTRYCWLNYKFPYTDSKKRRYSGGIGIDVTQRILAEEALFKAEEELKRYTDELQIREEEALEIIDGFTEGSWIVDRLDGTIKCSEKWSKRIGLDRVPKKERLSYTHTLQHTKDTADGNSIEYCIEMGLTRFDLEYRVKTVDSGYIWTQNKGKIVYDANGTAIKVYAATIDITKRKRTEEELRDSEERFRVAQELSPDGFTILRPMRDVNGQIVDFIWLYENDAIARMNGTNAKAIVGLRLLELFPNHRGTPILEAYLHVAETGEPRIFETAYGPETMIRSSWFRIVVVRMNSDIAILAQDITEHKRSEEELRESEIRAHELVKVLEETDKNKNKFISVLSHELRNPLAAISVGLSVLEGATDKQQTESVKGIIKRQVNQLCKLVDDLLDLTRITKNKINLKKENILLNEIVRDAVKDIMPEYVKKGVQLLVKIHRQPILLYADPIRITQCIGNLLHNAVKFTPANGNVWISLKQENNEAILSVQDNGIGINQEILERLFHPFTQADESLNRTDNNGLGLGLSIVKGIVELHDGKVTATSEGLGKGALFTIHLPALPGITKKRENTAISKGQRGFKILIIEDNKDLSELLCSMFSMWGHVAYTAFDGIEGIAKAQELQPEIIFCDIGLPGKNGFDVAKIIKEDVVLKKAFLIALSGYTGEHNIDQLIKSGFDRHIAKPIDMDNLKEMLSEDLDRWQCFSLKQSI